MVSFTRYFLLFTLFSASLFLVYLKSVLRHFQAFWAVQAFAGLNNQKLWFDPKFEMNEIFFEGTKTILRNLNWICSKSIERLAKRL